MIDTVFRILTCLVAEILLETEFSVMAALFAYFSIISPNSLNANNRISIGPYSEASKITTVKNPQGGGHLWVAHGLLRERDRQRDNFQNCYIFVVRRAGCHAGIRVTHNLASLVVALLCGQSHDFRVCRRVTRRVHNRVCARVGVFCIKLEINHLIQTCDKLVYCV